MWVFLFILAIVPMVYYWSDSITTLFPQLAQYFPEKGDSAKSTKGGLAGQPSLAQLLPTKWAEANTENGYAIWLMSSDNLYRIAAGCRTGEPPAIYLTRLNGQGLPDSLILDFDYGRLPLVNGTFTGSTSDLMNAVSQFGTMALQLPQTSEQEKAGEPGNTVAWFKVDIRESGLMTRGLQQNCGYSE